MITLGTKTVLKADECLHNFQVKWLYDSEIDQFYGDTRFPNAIAFPTPCPVTMHKNKIMDMGDIPFYGTAAANIQSQNIANRRFGKTRPNRILLTREIHSARMRLS